MLTQENQVEVRVLARQGVPIRAIARQMGVSRNTVRRYLRSEQLRRYGPRRPRRTKLDPFKAYLSDRMKIAGRVVIPATVLLREIREQGYRGGVSQLKAFLASIRPGKAPEPLIRFETQPGVQMQVDFKPLRPQGLRRWQSRPT